jgi:predicted MFS family arabinose efflux permease
MPSETPLLNAGQKAAPMISAAAPTTGGAASVQAAIACHPRELAILLTLAAMQFTHVLDFMIMMPLGPQFMRLMALDPQHFAFLVSASTFAVAASGFVSATWRIHVLPDGSHAPD